MMERQRALADVVRAGSRTSRASRRSSAPTAPTRRPTAGASRSRSKPRGERDARRRGDHRAPRARSSPRSTASRVYLQSVQDLQIDSRVEPHAVPVHARGRRPDELARLGAARARASCATLPELADVASDQQSGGPAVSLTIDRDTASRLGVSPQAIDDTLYDAFGQRQVSTIFTQLNLYRVILEVEAGVPAEPRGARRSIYVRVDRPATQVPLARVRALRADRPRRSSINHQGQFPAVTLSFNLAPGVSLGDAVDAIAARERDIGLPPRRARATSRARRAAFSDSLASEPLLILAALITVYIVLGVLYESYIHPITILSTLPSAGVGALLALIVCRHASSASSRSSASSCSSAS